MLRFLIVLFVLFAVAIPKSESRPTKRCSGDRLCFSHNKYLDKSNNKIYCDLCEIFLPVLRGYINENKTERISELAVYACDLFEDNVVCSQIVDLFITPVVSIVRDSPMNSKELCSLGLECSSDENPFFNWNIVNESFYTKIFNLSLNFNFFQIDSTIYSQARSQADSISQGFKKLFFF